MGLYFHADGLPKLKFLTIQSLFLGILYVNSHHYSLLVTKDSSMSPYLQTKTAKNQNYISYLFNLLLRSDIVLYKYIAEYQKTTALKGKLIAIKDPQGNGTILTRRVIGVQGEWVRRVDDSGFVQIPREHLWIECENDKFR